MPELSKEQLYIILGLIILLVLGGVWAQNKPKTIITPSQTGTSQSSPISSNAREIYHNKAKNEDILVSVGGSVAKEGLYKLYKGDRMADLLKLCGLKGDPDVENINLAEVLSDGQKVFISPRRRVSVKSSDNIFPSGGSGGKVDINSADAGMLDSLPGIGATTAKRIIEYRESKGRFMQVDDLKKVQGITAKKFESLKSLISTN